MTNEENNKLSDCGLAGAGLDTWSHNIAYKLACIKILFNILMDYNRYLQ